MRHTITSQTIAFVAGGLTVVGLAIGGAAVALDNTTAPDAQVQVEQAAPVDTALAGVTYMFECSTELVQEPASFTLACGDAGQSLDGLTWTNWGTPNATATGEMIVKGEGQRFPVTVTATDLVLGEASATYATLETTLTDTVPTGLDANETFKLATTDAIG